jgi:hypothetical protein
MIIHIISMQITKNRLDVVKCHWKLFGSSVRCTSIKHLTNFNHAFHLFSSNTRLKWLFSGVWVITLATLTFLFSTRLHKDGYWVGAFSYPWILPKQCFMSISNAKRTMLKELIFSMHYPFPKRIILRFYFDPGERFSLKVFNYVTTAATKCLRIVA